MRWVSVVGLRIVEGRRYEVLAYHAGLRWPTVAVWHSRIGWHLPAQTDRLGVTHLRA